VPKVLDLSEFLREFRDLVSHTLDPRIHIVIESQPGLAPVWIDPAHLRTAMLNLAINARDAMPSGGTLRIEALGKNGAAAGGTNGGKPDRFAVIRVSDTGTGITPENLVKVCEPFFSTKGLNGTGLGLSMVYGFVKQSGGDLHIASEPGVGTSVEIALPFTASDALMLQS
jgi:signal transduction histidine kinase